MSVSLIKQIGSKAVLTACVASTLFATSCSLLDDILNPVPQPEPVLSLPFDSLAPVLQRGDWHLAQFVDENQDYTYLFAEYKFSFLQGGNVSAISRTDTVAGSWSLQGDDSLAKMNLGFADIEPWKELTEDWVIVYASRERIILQDIDDNGLIKSSLIFVHSRHHDDDGGNGGIDTIANEFANILVAGNWNIQSFTEDGEDKTSEFTDHSLQFGYEGYVTLSNNVFHQRGKWAITRGLPTIELGPIHLLIEFNGNNNLNSEEISKHWFVSVYTDNAIELISTDDDGSVESTLILSRQ